MKIPLTAKNLGEMPRSLTPDEWAELVRWIDMLDRIEAGQRTTFVGA